jgi:hypothetical protein
MANDETAGFLFSGCLSLGLSIIIGHIYGQTYGTGTFSILWPMISILIAHFGL